MYAMPSKYETFVGFVRFWLSRRWFGGEQRKSWRGRVEFVARERAEKLAEAARVSKLHREARDRLTNTLQTYVDKVDPIEDLTQTIRIDGNKR